MNTLRMNTLNMLRSSSCRHTKHIHLCRACELGELDQFVDVFR